MVYRALPPVPMCQRHPVAAAVDRCGACDAPMGAPCSGSVGLSALCLTCARRARDRRIRRLVAAFVIAPALIVTALCVALTAPVEGPEAKTWALVTEWADQQPCRALPPFLLADAYADHAGLLVHMHAVCVEQRATIDAQLWRDMGDRDWTAAARSLKAAVALYPDSEATIRASLDALREGQLDRVVDIASRTLADGWDPVAYLLLRGAYRAYGYEELALRLDVWARCER
jgi:hypothetical protein